MLVMDGMDKQHPSHPIRVRGLKHTLECDTTNSTVSHPIRVRGLKLLYGTGIVGLTVAPYTGAWIETFQE